GQPVMNRSKQGPVWVRQLLSFYSSVWVSVSAVSLRPNLEKIAEEQTTYQKLLNPPMSVAAVTGGHYEMPSREINRTADVENLGACANHQHSLCLWFHGCICARWRAFRRRTWRWPLGRAWKSLRWPQRTSWRSYRRQAWIH